jgi:EAL domain-containing protein (putative c-di-GMP-specific phosphodiesterase class I)
VQTSGGVLYSCLVAGLLYWQLKRAEQSLKRSAGAARTGAKVSSLADPCERRAAAHRQPRRTARAATAWTPEPKRPADETGTAATHQAQLPAFVAAALSRRVAVEASLLLASLDDEFTLQLQPRWCVRTRQTLGAEALLRWHCPGLGAVPPDEFIPIAERHPVIRQLGRWMVVQVVRTLASRRERHPALQIAINLSACQLQDDDFPRFVAATVAEAGLAPSCIQFELTKTSRVYSLDGARSFLEALRGDGFTVALDDFGAGCSSLSCLARLPVDVIKLDRSFVNHLPDDPAARVVAAGIIAMAQRLGIRTVGEGVETEAQRHFLEGAGCREAQGWLVCEALSVEDFFRRQERHAVCTLARRLV